MGLLDGMLGGLVGGEMATLVNQFVAQNGGVSGIVSKFEKAGLASTVQSWVGTGANAPVSGDQIQQALGSDLMQQLTAKTGLSSDVLAQKLAQFLPEVVDKLTPGGVVPKS